MRSLILALTPLQVLRGTYIDWNDSILQRVRYKAVSCLAFSCHPILYRSCLSKRPFFMPLSQLSTEWGATFSGLIESSVLKSRNAFRPYQSSRCASFASRNGTRVSFAYFVYYIATFSRLVGPLSSAYSSLRSTFFLPLTQSVSFNVISGVPNKALSTASTPSMNW